jgi:hypothetical protein
MRTSFSTSFVEGTKVPIQVDEITTAFHNARVVDKVYGWTIVEKAVTMYGVTTSEMKAISTWIESYLIGESTISGSVQFADSKRLKNRKLTYLSTASLSCHQPWVYASGQRT